MSNQERQNQQNQGQQSPGQQPQQGGQDKQRQDQQRQQSPQGRVTIKEFPPRFHQFDPSYDVRAAQARTSRRQIPSPYTPPGKTVLGDLLSRLVEC